MIKKSVSLIYLIHAHPLEKVGDWFVYPPVGFYRFSNHISAIRGRISGAFNLQCFHADIETARRAGNGAVFTAFGKTSQEVSRTFDITALNRVVDEDTTAVVLVCELDQLSALMNQACTEFGIVPPGLSSFPNGGMVEINITGGRANVLSGDK